MKRRSPSPLRPALWARLRLSLRHGLQAGVLALGLLGGGLHGPAPVQAQAGAQTPATPVPSTAGPTRLPSLGDGSEIPLGEERRLGDSIVREILRDPDVIDDPLLADYVGQLWQRLREAARQRGEISNELEEQFAWELMLIRDKSVNAFALPGGYMGVHLGLIGVVVSRDELASVLAHELSHITQRHIARLLTQQQKQTPMMMAAMIVGLLAASRNPQAAQAMMVGGQAVAIQNQLNFSRDMEREADRVGYGVANQAGFEPSGFVTMFEKLLQASRLNDSGGFPYLRSHPLTTERIADMQARQQLLPLTQRPTADWEHTLLSARARVLANPGMDAQRNFSLDANSVQADPLRRAAALYAAVLAETRLRDHDRARQHLSQLQLITQAEPIARALVQVLSAEVYLATGQALQAISVLEPLPPQFATQVLLAQARIATGLPAQGRLAAEALQKLASAHPRERQLLDLLGQALGLQGDSLRSLRVQAESSAMRWDYVGALDRLRMAQEIARTRARTGSLSRSDEMEAAIIDARVRVYQSARREQVLQR
jgi:predicted Zn-dependent protease